MRCWAGKSAAAPERIWGGSSTWSSIRAGRCVPRSRLRGLPRGWQPQDRCRLECPPFALGRKEPIILDLTHDQVKAAPEYKDGRPPGTDRHSRDPAALSGFRVGFAPCFCGCKTPLGGNLTTASATSLSLDQCWSRRAGHILRLVPRKRRRHAVLRGKLHESLVAQSAGDRLQPLHAQCRSHTGRFFQSMRLGHGSPAEPSYRAWPFHANTSWMISTPLKAHAQLPDRRDR